MKRRLLTTMWIRADGGVGVEECWRTLEEEVP